MQSRITDAKEGLTLLEFVGQTDWKWESSKRLSSQRTSDVFLLLVHYSWSRGVYFHYKTRDRDWRKEFKGWREENHNNNNMNNRVCWDIQDMVIPKSLPFGSVISMSKKRKVANWAFEAMKVSASSKHLCTVMQIDRQSWRSKTQADNNNHNNFKRLSWDAQKCRVSLVSLSVSVGTSGFGGKRSQSCASTQCTESLLTLWDKRSHIPRKRQEVDSSSVLSWRWLLKMRGHCFILFFHERRQRLLPRKRQMM
jgi:hypothetical protein